MTTLCYVVLSGWECTCVMTPRVGIKVAQIARLRTSGNIKDERICEMFGMTRSGLSRILATPEYQQEEEAVLNGTLSKMDEALAGRAEEMKKTFSVGVPAAMRALLETVAQRKDLRARMEAAKEILDRDPERTFSRFRVAQGLPQNTAIPDAVLGATAETADSVAATIATKKEVVQ